METFGWDFNIPTSTSYKLNAAHSGGFQFWRGRPVIAKRFYGPPEYNKAMYFVYVLRSKKDSGLYIGYSSNLKSRYATHLAGSVLATKHRQPMHLIYYEAYIARADAKGREKFLKSGSGHRFLKKQLRNYFAAFSQTL